MLQYLRIRDFGIFSVADVELGPGLSVFTGETGAGKSMVVDAVMACLGQRTSRDLIRSGAERAVVELLAQIPLSPEVEGEEEVQDRPSAGEFREVLLQKDIMPERSYVRIDGRLATAAMAQKIGSRLVDIHGQQEHHSLLRPENYIRILDSMNKGKTAGLRTRLFDLYRRRQAIMAQIKELGESEAQHVREMDLLSFQVQEITGTGLMHGEEEELSTRFKVLSSQRRLIELSSAAYELLYEGSRGQGSAFQAVEEALGLLGKACAVDPACGKVREALSQVGFSLEMALDVLREYRSNLSLDPDKLTQVSDRLDLIQRLKSKYGPTLKDVLEYEERAKARLDMLLHAGETLQDLKSRLRETESELAEAGKLLSGARREVAGQMTGQVTKHLGELGMPGAQFIINFEAEDDPETGVFFDGTRKRVFPHGFDRIGFHFTANPGQMPLPVHKVASGGELSRLMLAIKSYMEEADPVPTLIFDEIDAGIGGKAGQAVAEKLWRLGRTHQVLCVTHLASIASMADRHYLVSKTEEGGQTYAHVKSLSEKDRPAEIGRMLSGSDLEISRAHAEELLRSAREHKKAFP